MARATGRSPVVGFEADQPFLLSSGLAPAVDSSSFSPLLLFFPSPPSARSPTMSGGSMSQIKLFAGASRLVESSAARAARPPIFDRRACSVAAAGLPSPTSEAELVACLSFSTAFAHQGRATRRSPSGSPSGGSPELVPSASRPLTHARRRHPRDRPSQTRCPSRRGLDHQERRRRVADQDARVGPRV